MTAATVRAQQIPAEVLYWEHVNSRRAGHQTTIGEIEGLMHFWRYVGDLLGVQPDDYSETFRDSTIQLTFASMVKRAYSAGRDGEEPVESYVPVFRPRPSSPVGKLQFPVVFTLEAFRR